MQVENRPHLTRVIDYLFLLPKVWALLIFLPRVDMVHWRVAFLNTGLGAGSGVHQHPSAGAVMANDSRTAGVPWPILCDQARMHTHGQAVCASQ